jgi:hypothetical protein
VNEPESNNSRGTTARNELGEGALVSKSFNQFSENDAITNVDEQQTLDNSNAQHGEMRILSEELFETDKLAPISSLKPSVARRSYPKNISTFSPGLPGTQQTLHQTGSREYFISNSAS